MSTQTPDDRSADDPPTDELPAPLLAAGAPEPPTAGYDVALLDLDGVVYVGPDAVPGVPEALAAARTAGMRLAYVTNNAARTPQDVATHLTDLGVPADPADVITSSQAAATLVLERWGAGARVLPVGGPGVAAALESAGLSVVRTAEEQPVAVVQGYGRDVGWTDLAEAVVAIRGAGQGSDHTDGAVHVATNTDATIPSPRGVLPGNGALVGVVRAVTGQEPVVAGKPDPTMHAECVRRTGARRPLVVGDRLDTDIEGGRRAGSATLLVFSGVTDPRALLAAGPLHRPDLLAADAGGLLRPHPAVHPAADGAWRCGDWVARADGDRIELSWSAAAEAGEDEPQSDDGFDGLRALCVAHWTAHPDGAVPAGVDGSDDQARQALQGWGVQAD